MCQIEKYFFRKSDVVFLMDGFGAFDADANFPGLAEFGIAGKGNDIGRGRIAEEGSVEFANIIISQKNDGQIALCYSESGI